MFDPLNPNSELENPLQDELSPKKEAEKPKSNHFVPTLEYYQKTYAQCMPEDKRAVQVFKSFESQERMRRLQAELQWIKDGKVSEVIMDKVIGKKRCFRFGSYKHWAELMLLWIVQARA